MKVGNTRALMTGIVQRAMTPGRLGLGSWAYRQNDDPDRLSIAPHASSDWQTVDWEVVARGVWRVTGGQSMDRPTGFTEEMADQLSRALSDLDPEQLDPATASAVIQVGLYREVRYR
jgi:hypothetical protein